MTAADRLARLRIFLDHLRSPTEDLIRVQGDRLYHYTDLTALCGIVTGHDIWLTHSRFCNDEQELKHGTEVARWTVGEELRHTRKQTRRWRFLELVRSYLDVTLPQGVYVCCFCTRRDLLTQWRTYGANGTGVSIAFRVQEFQAVTGPDSPADGLMRLWGVSYNLTRQRELVARILRFGAGQITPHTSLEEHARLTADAIEFFIPTFKNGAFEDESEARLIFTPPLHFPPPRFRSSRGMLIPYYTLQQLAPHAFGSPPRLPIAEVDIGPSALRDVNRDAAEILLRSNGYDVAEVNTSGTPYRG